jgi:excisionase family DNA binding protein
MTESLTLAEAAEALGKSRRTVGRLIAAGGLEGAVKTAQGWSIPAETIDAMTGPTSTDQTEDTTDAAPDAGPSAAMAEIQRELEQWRRRAEVAEAVAAERGDALNDARVSLALAQRLAAVTLAEAVQVREIEPKNTERRWRLRRKK